MIRTIENCRKDFPALQRQYNGRNIVYLDGPAGTQVPTLVIDAISDYYKTSNANTHGQFITTQETDVIMSGVRSKVADFLGAPNGSTISFGQNMTTLNYSLSRAIGRILKSGDEIIITQLDHEANRGPWLSLKEWGIEVIEVEMYPEGVLNYEDFESKINERTKLVAVGGASNLTGTVNDLALIRKLTNEVGAWLLVDAVHLAPHIPIDVVEMDCDFLLCSAYKFYGPHIGLIYSKPGLLKSLPTDRLITQEQEAPYRIETGTLNHAAIAGVGAAVDYIESFGVGDTCRKRLINAMTKIRNYEHDLGNKLYDGLKQIPGIQIKGLSFEQMSRTPTISFFTLQITSEEICNRLGSNGICAWDGHFYARRGVEVMGLLDKGGVTRMGISVYNTDEEIDYTSEAITQMMTK
ncbi:MAG: cysteine desulfurase-like protein [Bacteroidetes bacterium]|nr:cysteine desulfurase-like protein [Bacteroidota bacterium]MDA1119655.1 cysteine desulfurase-like protein [Bacteroidota bacterium]